MIYKSVLVLFTMFAGVFAANDVFCGGFDVISKSRPCHGHAVCPNGNCHFKKGHEPRKPSANLPISTGGDVSNESKSLPPAFASQPAALSQQELVVSRVDNASILHTVSSDASKPMILTSIVDANVTKSDVSAAVVVSKNEVLPTETSALVVESHRSDSTTLGDREVVNALQPEEQDNRSGAEQDPRTQLHIEDVVTDVEGEISTSKPTELVSVESDKSTKSKAKKLHKNAEDGKADNYETDAEQDDEGDEEVEDDENSDKNSQKLSFKAKINRGKKSDTSAGA